MQKKDHELHELKLLLSKLQGAAPHPAATAVPATAPAGFDSPSTHAGAQHSAAPGADTLKRPRSADRLQEDSGAQNAGGMDLQDSGAAAANAPQHKRTNMGTHSAAARTSSTGLAPPPPRGMKPLPAGKTVFSKQMQAPAHSNMPAGTVTYRKAGDRGAQAAAEQDAAGLLQFLAGSTPGTGQQQGQPTAGQHPAQPSAAHERQHAENAVYAYLKQHGGSSSTTNRVRGNSSGGGGSGGVMSSDGGSAATGFSPAPHHHNQQQHNILPSAMRAAAAAALAAECAAAGDASGFQHLMGLNGAPNQAMHGTGGHQGAAAGDPYHFMAGSAQQMGGTMHGMMPAAAALLPGNGNGFQGWQMPGMQGSMAAAAAAAGGMGTPAQQLEMAQPQDPRRGSTSSAGRRGSKADDQMPVDSSTRPWLNLAN